MKRSPMPGRRAALSPGGPLKRTPMPPRKKGLKRRAIKASRPKASPAERAGKKVVHTRSGGVCEACGEAEAIHWHHRINEGQGGPWSASNGMHVCLTCHLWIGDYPTSASVLGWHLEPWHDQDGNLTRDPAIEPLRYRGTWVVLGDDGAVTPTVIPESALKLLARHKIGASA